MAFAVVAQYRCDPADADTVRDALVRMRALVPSEPANLAYEVHAEVDRPGSFVLYERYTDRAGFEAHRETDHFAELILGTVLPLLTERTVTFARTLDDAGGQNSLPQQ
ncbi:putative quinol monooxygenase [Streptomyces olivaceoviridis]|uniref:putative quinol monooxygenase n=1 Tax=Streptomyces olivaceoviridis TaxID=1921 RepID=UPI003701F921